MSLFKVDLFSEPVNSEPASKVSSKLTSSMSLVDSEPASMASSKLTSLMSLVNSEPASIVLSKIDLFSEPV